ncbi:MAG: glycoside hydrolase family 127 protein [Acutalibacteraceae bacterium]|jgi:hypothetical protein
MTGKPKVSQVKITGGFWKEKQELNRKVTLKSVREQFEQTGRFAAFKFDWTEDKPHRPHIFWDSDVAKWLESAAFILSKNRDDELEAFVDSIVELIEKNQGEDGYFNIYFTVCEPENRFYIRSAHELYCAGHLMEAAVAYYEATGKDKFLKAVCRYADYIEKVFKIENSAEFSTPGHEEIELALVKLYNCTGEKRYLELSRHFLDIRGTAEAKEVISGEANEYTQDHLPVREQTDAKGHSVRACYLFSGMADLSREYEDKTLYDACIRLFKNIVHKRMYITGGIGSTNNGEAFTVDYDLPNDTAYAETCAAISLYMFANRMSLIEPDGIFADTAERAMYNGILSGLSLDGKSFFYENPLEIDLEWRKAPKNEKINYPLTQRKEVFSCSCCPPNVTRFIASVEENIYSFAGSTLFVHHYMQSEADFNFDGAEVKISQSTEYPLNGLVNLRVSGMKGKVLALRIPGWCSDWSVILNSEKVEPKNRKGYVYLDIGEDEADISLNMDMPSRWIKADPRVTDCAGKVALQRGPLVYCVEGVDNSGSLSAIRADTAVPPQVCEPLFAGLPALEAGGYVIQEGEALYTLSGEGEKSINIKFIPYFAFANRGESDMRVWVYKY